MTLKYKEQLVAEADEADTDKRVDYEKLRLILEKQYGRKVPLTEAIGTGKFLLNIYEILLDNRGAYDKI